MESRANLDRQTTGNVRAPHQKLVLASAALCILASAILLFMPAGVASLSRSGTTTTGAGSGGSETRTTEMRLLVGEIDTADLVIFAVPAVVAAVPLLVRRRRPPIVARATAAGLLFLWVLLLALGGGILYIPSAGLMVIAAVLAGSDTGRPAVSAPSSFPEVQDP